MNKFKQGQLVTYVRPELAGAYCEPNNLIQPMRIVGVGSRPGVWIVDADSPEGLITCQLHEGNLKSVEDDPKTHIDENLKKLPNTGEQTSFSTGAVRDAAKGKGFPHMIPPIGIRKIAKRFEDGAVNYGPHNWMKGIPLSRYVDAIKRHCMAWEEGQTNEDHLAAIGWNMVCAAWTEEQIANGNLPAELNNLPFRPENLNKLLGK